MPIILELLISYISSVGFAYLFGCSHKAAFISGVAGSLGWVVYKLTNRYFNAIYLSVVAGSYVVATLGERFAKKFHMPASMFIIPGIANLAPGAGIYYTLSFFVHEQNQLAQAKLTETLLIAGSIAFGITLASAGSKSLRKYKTRKPDRIEYIDKKLIERQEK